MTKATTIRETNGKRAVTLYRSSNGTLYAQSQSRPNVRYCLGAAGDRWQCFGFQMRGACERVQAAALLKAMLEPQPAARPTCARCERVAVGSGPYPALCAPCAAQQCIDDLYGDR